MKIINYPYNFNQQRNNLGYSYKTVMFKANLPEAHFLNGGLLSDAAQKGIESIHKNLASIKELYMLFASYPPKANAIKNGYSRLMQNNKHQGLAFFLPDNRGSIIVRQLKSDTDMVKFIVEDRGEKKDIYAKGYSRIIANINPKKPNYLPKNYRCMDDEELKASNAEEYIRIAQKELQDYYDYLVQFRDPEKRKNVPIVQKSAGAISSEILTPKDNLNKINELMNKTPEEFPIDFKLKKTLDGKILGFSFNADDGALVRVAKSANQNYGNNVLYLKISKQYDDGRRTAMAVDLVTKKFLKLKDDGKPVIRNDVLYEYSDEEVKRRNMYSKLTDYVNEIYKKFDKTEKPNTPEIVVNQTETLEKHEEMPKKKVRRKTKSETPSEKKVPVEPKVSMPDMNFEKMKSITEEKAKKDAKMLADIYIKTFTETFNELITKKLSDFKSNIDKIFVKE